MRRSRSCATSVVIDCNYKFVEITSDTPSFRVSKLLTGGLIGLAGLRTQEIEIWYTDGHHFVLVHGASYGAWEWQKLAEWLEKAGYKAAAVNLADCGTHPAAPNTITTYSEYLKPLKDSMASLSVEKDDEFTHLVEKDFKHIEVQARVFVFMLQEVQLVGNR